MKYYIVEIRHCQVLDNYLAVINDDEEFFDVMYDDKNFDLVQELFYDLAESFSYLWTNEIENEDDDEEYVDARETFIEGFSFELIEIEEAEFLEELKHNRILVNSTDCIFE